MRQPGSELLTRPARRADLETIVHLLADDVLGVQRRVHVVAPFTLPGAWPMANIN